jgi:hypothetical protein
MCETETITYTALDAKLEKLLAGQEDQSREYRNVTLVIIVSLGVLITIGVYHTAILMESLEKRIDSLKQQAGMTGRSFATPIVLADLHSTQLPTRLGPRVMKRFNSGEVMHEGDSLQSDDREYELILQEGGNLILYRYKLYEPKRVIWQSNTGQTGAQRQFSLVLKADNPHLTLLTGEGQVRWTFSFDTHEKPNPQALAVKLCDGQLTAFRVGKGEVVCP